MRTRFELLLLAPTALIATSPVLAEDFLSVEQAQQMLFPGAQFAPADFVLSDTQLELLAQKISTRVWRRQVKAWRVSSGGWFFVDQVIGRDDRVTYALGLDKDGAVRGVEILTCLAKYDGIRRPEWRAQFNGRRYGKLDMLDQISIVSGATMSTTHINEGV
jgi:hypothetical protein